MNNNLKYSTKRLELHWKWSLLSLHFSSVYKKTWQLSKKPHICINHNKTNNFPRLFKGNCNVFFGHPIQLITRRVNKIICAHTLSSAKRPKICQYPIKRCAYNPYKHVFMHHLFMGRDNTLFPFFLSVECWESEWTMSIWVSLSVAIFSDLQLWKVQSQKNL